MNCGIAGFKNEEVDKSLAESEWSTKEELGRSHDICIRQSPVQAVENKRRCQSWRWTLYTLTLAPENLTFGRQL